MGWWDRGIGYAYPVLGDPVRLLPLFIAGLGIAAVGSTAVGQSRRATPLRQSDLTVESATVRPLTIRDASRNSRWVGLGVRDVRWAPDGSVTTLLG